MSRGGPGTATPPVELGVGIDCEELARWRALLPRIRQGAFGRAFDEAERAWCERWTDPAASFAGRWCAKEAVVKALAGLVRITPRDVRIRVDEGGAPVAEVEALRRRPDVALRVSITHSSLQAMAFAVAVGRPDRGSP